MKLHKFLIAFLILTFLLLGAGCIIYGVSFYATPNVVTIVTHEVTDVNSSWDAALGPIFLGVGLLAAASIIMGMVWVTR